MPTNQAEGVGRDVLQEIRPPALRRAGAGTLNLPPHALVRFRKQTRRGF